jgi:membrane-associated protein
MTGFLDRLLNLHGAVVYLLVAAFVFTEDALFVGFVLPGETAAVLGGVAASRGHVSLALMLFAVVAAAIVGDSVGYEVGRRLGPRLLRMSLLQRRQQRLDDARRFLARRGGTAVFFGRFVAFFRAVMPALAGVAAMPYRRFLTYNAAGGLVWGTAAVLLGYLAGNSYATVEKVAGQGAAVVVAALVVVALVARHVHRRYTKRARLDAAAQRHDEPGHSTE